jgi:diadenosine tetraphosphate (Ap4A) HIT family hydrolase
MMATVQKVAKAVDKALAPDGILLKQYNRAPAGQSVFHVHFHANPAGVSAHALPVGGCRASVREVRLSARVTKPVDS